ncbi:MAG: ribulose-phosphate 3-epimerase [Rickettsiales bacterium]|jgi:ribulose-phosphate 3-epimerase|nr:ribulose-phosphate 3-epimerase [Rickettsiales bacterium]
MHKTISLSVGISSTDFFDIKNTIAKINSSCADAVHMDVMDGVFVPNITYGAAFIKSLRPHTKKRFDTHLMLADPLPYIEDFVAAGADEIKLHVESKNFLRALRLAKSLGVKAGVAVNASTPLSKFEKYLPLADSVMLMMAKTGFAGQPFQPKLLAKLRRVAERMGGRDVQVDGGINFETAKLCVDAGANSIVSGSFIFKQKDFNAAARKFKSLG